MNWKARALVTEALPSQQMSSIIARGKPLPYNQAVQLIGMILRAEGETVEGVIVKPKPKTKKKQSVTASTIGEYVSSEDRKTPWADILKEAKDDDRLQMAIEKGIVTPIKK